MMRYKGMMIVLGWITIFGFSRCGVKDTKEGENKDMEKTTLGNKEQKREVREEAKATPKPEPAIAELKYSAYPLKGVDSAVKVFKAKYSPEQRWLILALNRLDEGNIKRADTLIIPDEVLPDFNAYSPFPPSVALLKNINKIVIFSYAIQAFAAYERGALVYWGPTSMGSKIHPTPTGLHFSNWKAKETISTVNDEWKLKWNFNIENKEGVGWHQYAMPGYPASHSCLRMLEQQAKWMYTWANQWIVKDQNTVLAQGTPVIVYGAYPFGSRRPWRNMLEDPKANTISEADLDKEIQPFLQRIQEQQDRRVKVEMMRSEGNRDSTIAAVK